MVVSISRKAEIFLLLSIFCLALFVRLAFNVWFVGIQAVPVSDAACYSQMAKAFLKNGEVITLARPPLFPIVMAGIYGIFGENYFAVRCFLSVIGSITCLVVFWIGKAAFDARSGLYAAAISAVYAMMFHWNGYLLTETLFTFLLSLSILYFIKSWIRPTGIHFVLTGLFLGMATLTRPIPILFTPFIFIWSFVVFRGRTRLAFQSSIIITGCMLLILMPWTIRNLVITGHVIPVTTMGGTVLLGANNPRVLHSFKGGWVHPRQSGLMTQNEIEKEDQMSEIEVDFLRRKKAVDFMFQNPLLVTKLCFYKFKLFWHLHRDLHLRSIQYLLVMVFAAVGAIRAQGITRKLFILYLIPIFFTLSALIFWGDDRIRAPIEPILVVFAGAGIHSIIRKFSVFNVSKVRSISCNMDATDT